MWPQYGREPGREKRPDDLRVSVGTPLRGAGAGGGRLERRIVTQDPPLELLELLPRQQADLVEAAAALVKGGVCLDVAAGLVERKHQVANQFLAVTVECDEVLELGDDFGVPAESTVGADSVLERGETMPRETADLVRHARLEREVRQRLAAPEVERLPKGRGAVGGSLAPRALAELL